MSKSKRFLDLNKALEIYGRFERPRDFFGGARTVLEEQ
jgi:hypothetical protein